MENNGEDSAVNGVEINENGDIREFKAKVNDGNGEIEFNVPTTNKSEK